MTEQDDLDKFNGRWWHNHETLDSKDVVIWSPPEYVKQIQIKS